MGSRAWECAGAKEDEVSAASAAGAGAGVTPSVEEHWVKTAPASIPPPVLVNTPIVSIPSASWRCRRSMAAVFDVEAEESEESVLPLVIGAISGVGIEREEARSEATAEELDAVTAAIVGRGVLIACGAPSVAGLAEASLSSQRDFSFSITRAEV